MTSMVAPDAEADAGGRDRYHRQSLISWWRQDVLAKARVLVVGAGALGNEVMKLLALSGAGRVLVLDFDRIEHSNLSRSVLFRDGDEGAAKAVVAARRAGELNPGMVVVGRVQNVLHETGLGIFHWADVVISGVDNREARVFINAACARTGKTWIDGAIEGVDGVARAFHPASGPCYECTMNATDRRLLAERRSCALLARDVAAGGHVPTTAVAASLVASLQVQEAIKVLHGRATLVGAALHFDGNTATADRIRYQRREECPGHDRYGDVAPLGRGVSDVTAGALLERAERRLGDGACIDLSRDFVQSLVCEGCEQTSPHPAPLGAVREREARCPRCGAHRVVSIASTIARDGVIDLSRTLRELGVPPFDLVVARQGADRVETWILDGDASEALGPLQDAPGGTKET